MAVSVAAKAAFSALSVSPTAAADAAFSSMFLASPLNCSAPN